MGIVWHGDDSWFPFMEKQTQTDVISVPHLNLSELPMKVMYEHMHGHLDDIMTLSILHVLFATTVECHCRY